MSGEVRYGMDREKYSVIKGDWFGRECSNTEADKDFLRGGNSGGGQIRRCVLASVLVEATA